MMRLLAAASAGALFVLLCLATPARAVAVVGLVGLLLAAVAIAVLWRWLATAAACVFLVGYAVALWIERRPVDVLPPLGFGLALVLLLEAVDLACRTRGATIHGGVVRAALGRWAVLGAGSLLTVILTMELAARLAGALPAVASPLLAVAGALGSVLVLAALCRRAG
jgi:xanthosine utilization system XapX-like protein